MRITRLDLRRFGHFEDRVFALDPAAGVHVLYGPNEAGKSTILDGITYALHGMPTRQTATTPTYAFRFPAEKLRIGLTLRTAAGDTLDLVRRRGNKGTVLDPATDAADVELEAALTRLLQPVPVDLWRAKYGLSRESLREGATALLEGRGNAGDALFAVAGGMTNLHGVLDELRAQRDLLLKHGGRSGAIPEAVKEHAEGAKGVRAAQSDVRTYERLRGEQTLAVDEHARLRATELAARTQVERLEALVAAAPELARHDELVRDAAAVAGLPVRWHATEQAAYDEAVAARAAATRTIDEDGALLAGERTRRDDAEPDAQLLAAEPAVDLLVQGVDTWRERREALPELLAAEHAADRAFRSALAALAPDADEDPAAARSRVPATVALEDLDAAIDEGALLDEDDTAARELHVERTRALDTARAAIDEHAGGTEQLDLARLESALEVAAQVSEDELELLVAEVDQETAALERRAAALPGCELDLAGVRTAALPPTSELALVGTRIEEREAGLETLRAERENARVHLDRRQTELQELEAGRTVHERDELERLRDSRDAHWRTLRETLTGGALPVAGDPTVDVYESEVRTADDYADRIAEDGELVGRAAALRARIEDDRRRIADADDQRAELTTALDEDRAAWTALWAPAGFAAASVAAMRAVYDEVERIRTAATETDGRRTRVLAQVRRRAELADGLAAALGTPLGTPPGTTPGTTTGTEGRGSLGELVVLARRRIAEHTATRERVAELRGAETSARRDLDDAVRRIEDVAARRAAWRERFDAACARVGLTEDAASLQAARAHLDAVHTLRASIDAAVQATATHAERAEQVARFERSVHEVVAGVTAAADLADQPADTALGQLAARCRESHRANSARQEIERTVERLDAGVRAARASQVAADEALGRLAATAGASTQDELAGMAAAWAARAELLAQARELEATIVAAARASVAELVELRAGRPVEELRLAVLEAREQADEHAARSIELEQERDERQRRLGELLRGSEEHAAARRRMVDAEARLERLVAEYRHVERQERLLAAFIEAQSQREMGPVLARSSDYFARLTCGDYDLLRLGVGDTGEPVLEAHRAEDDELLRIDALSEGTRDQLFLALRLATIVTGIEAGAEPVPLVVDDILQSFDDERAAATMSVLGDVGGHTQVLFLTHHRRLLELAAETLGDGDALDTHELTRRGRLATTS